MDRASEQDDAGDLPGTSIVIKVGGLLALAIVFALGIGALLILLETSVETPESVQIFDLVNIFAPLLFSLLVALIYWQLYDVQKFETRILSDQKDIQERQRRIEAQQLRPYVVVEDAHESSDDEIVWVKTSNFGHAPATNISLAVRVKVGEEVNKIGARRTRREEDGYNGFIGLGDFLRPDDEYVQFRVEYPDLNWYSMESEIPESLTLVAGLEYTDITDEVYFYPLQRSEVEPTNKPEYKDIEWEWVRHSDPA